MKEKLVSDVLNKIKEFEEKTGHRVVYVTVSGSILYGTNTPKSDMDFKGVYIPNFRDILLNKPQKPLVFNSSKEKNTKDDIDLTLHSVSDFLKHLKKSETGAIDLLFSMYRSDTIIYSDERFVDYMKNNHHKLKNSNMKAFIGYAVGQTRKFGIKGARYSELDKFYKICSNFFNLAPKDNKLGDYWWFLEETIKNNDMKYIKMIEAEGARKNSMESNIIPYCSILGKIYHQDVKIGYFMERLFTFYDQFGNRTKTVAQTNSKVDYKAMSHALRVALEVKEYLKTGFIKFPLYDSDKILRVKEGKVDEDEVLNEISEVLSEVDNILDNINSDEFPGDVPNEVLDEMIISIYLIFYPHISIMDI